ncbi:MAG TPA: VWA domain-containing protein [Bryobacteraceae bacterium]|nr:VWA domain-containing protein [Bryobacteraceae bacterium]
MRPRILMLFAFVAATAQIKVTTTLVQFDAVVTDNKGKPVTDLRREEFVLLDNGKPREIRNFSYVATGVQQLASIPATGAGRPTALPALKREEVRRTIAIVVDDLRLSFESLHYTRETLKKFVNTQLAPGDLLAILTTRGGTGALEQFTTDRNRLLAAINRLRPTLSAASALGTLKTIGEADAESASASRMTKRSFYVGTLGAIRHISEGMRTMPGRKSIILFSEGMQGSRLLNPKVSPPAQSLQPSQKDESIVDRNDLLRVAESANRSAVVLYAVDPRGVVYPGLRAEDDISNLEASEIRLAIDDRSAQLRSTQSMLELLAEETGGLAHINNNDLNGGMQRVLDDQSGYYLIGFQPDEAEAEKLAKDNKFGRIQLRVTRPNVKVRFRRSYISPAAATETQPRTPSERLVSALMSPFVESAIPIRFAPNFTTGDKDQPLIRSLVHIPANSVTFGPPGAGGKSEATLHLIVLTEGEEPKLSSNTAKTFTLQATAEEIARFQEKGFVYAVDHPVRKPGAYQVRIAILDERSGKTGAASRYLEVPDLERGAASISGILMADGDQRNATDKETGVDFSPVLRQFQRGRIFSYGVTVFNARRNGAEGQPGIELQPRLVRGETVVWEGKRFPVVLRPGMNARRIPAGGVLRLSEKTPPGEYVLEIQAIDIANNRVLSNQWIDFELQ